MFYNEAAGFFRKTMTGPCLANRLEARNLVRLTGILLLLSLLPVVVFWPGMHGPFIFDDINNITSNYYMRVTQLNLSSLYHAALSGMPGALGRPLPMVSFALNYYYGDGFNDTFPFKLTSLVIHILSGITIFLLFRILLLIGNKDKTENTANSNLYSTSVALVLSAIWLIHPIQANPVHYIVQRMTILSGLFVLIGMLSFVYGRILYKSNHRLSLFLLLAVLPLSFLLGMLSKENSVLLIPLIVLVDHCFFGNSPAWTWLANRNRKYLYSALAILFFGAILSLMWVALPGYHGRTFTMDERLMTEPRILFDYLGLIYFPVLNRFGLFHDDIAVSTGLFEPLTTIVAITCLFSISVLLFAYRKRFPSLFFGWYWFLIAHSIESSFLALELMHEHRNYIPMLGPLYATSGSLVYILKRYGRIAYTLLATALVLTVGFIGFLRSSDWKSQESLVLAESSYHPRSPRAQGGLGMLLVAKGDLQHGLSAMNNAYTLMPGETGYLVNMIIIKSMMREAVPEDWQARVFAATRFGHLSPLTMATLQSAASCALSRCSGARPVVEKSLALCSARSDIYNQQKAECLYYLGILKGSQGQHKEAINAMERSYELDKTYLLPLFGIAASYLETKDYASARSAIKRIIDANKVARYPRDEELAKIISTYNQIADQYALPGGKIEVSY